MEGGCGLDFIDWMSFLPSNFMGEISPNPEHQYLKKLVETSAVKHTQNYLLLIPFNSIHLHLLKIHKTGRNLHNMKILCLR